MAQTIRRALSAPVTWVLVLTLWGALIRVAYLNVQPFVFDETISASAAVGILRTGAPRFVSGVLYSRSMLHSYLMAGSFALLGPGEAAGRLPSVLFGALMIPLTYLTGRRLSGTRSGLIAAGLMAFLTWEMVYSRQARMYQQGQFFYLAALLCCHEVLIEGRLLRRNVLWLGVAVLLSVLTHTLTNVLVPLSVAYALLRHRGRCLAWARRHVGRFTWAQLALATLVIAPLLTAWGLYVRPDRMLDLAGINLGVLQQAVSFLWGDYAPLLLIAGLGAAGYLARAPWSGGYLLIIGLVNLVISALLAPVFEDRYLYVVLPPLMAFFCAEGVQIIARGWARVGGQIADGQGAPHRLVPAAVAAIVVGLAWPAFTLLPQARYVVETVPNPDYRRAYQIVAERMAPGDLVFVCTYSAPATFYLGEGYDPERHYDYRNLEGSALDAYRRWAEQSLMLVVRPQDGVLRDIYGDARVVQSYDAFREAWSAHPEAGVWFLGDRMIYVDGATQKLLEQSADETPVDGMSVFYLAPGDRPDA